MPRPLDIAAQVRDLIQFREDFLAGAYPQRSALGPGAISRSMMKAKSITSSMIDVSNLEAVSAQTGSLEVDGGITVGTGGSISSGLTSYDDLVHSGYWIDATPEVRIGSPTSYVTFDTGTGLKVRGEITADTGTLVDLNITGDLIMGNGLGLEGIIRGGKTSYASTTAGFWLGYSSGYKFKIGNVGSYLDWDGSSLNIKGAIAADSGTLTNLDINGTLNVTTGGIFKSGMSAWGTGAGWWFQNSAGTPVCAVGNGSTQGWSFNGTTMAMFGSTLLGEAVISVGGNIRSGATSYASGTGWILEYNGGTPRFRIGNAVGGTSYAAWDGSKFTVKGRIEFGTSDYLENNLLYFEVPTSETSKIQFKNASLANQSAQISAFSASTVTNMILGTYDAADAFDRNATISISSFTGTSGTEGGLINLSCFGTTAANSVDFDVSGRTGHVTAKLGDSAAACQFRVLDNGSAQVFGVDSDGSLIRPIANDATGGAGAYYGRVPVIIDGVLKYFRAYDS